MGHTSAIPLLSDGLGPKIISAANYYGNYKFAHLVRFELVKIFKRNLERKINPTHEAKVMVILSLSFSSLFFFNGLLSMFFLYVILKYFL